MTDEELIARLRVDEPMCEEHFTANLAADRIEALIEERGSLLAGHRALNIGGARLQDRAETAEAKLAKAVELLREIEEHLERISGFFFDTFPRKEIKATLAEIKGESHE